MSIVNYHGRNCDCCPIEVESSTVEGKKCSCGLPLETRMPTTEAVMRGDYNPDDPFEVCTMRGHEEVAHHDSVINRLICDYVHRKKLSNA